MQLREFLLVLRTRWRIVVLCTLVVVALAGVFTTRLTPTYTAQSSFYLAADAGRQEGTSGFVLTAEDLNTYVAVLRSPAVLRPLREELGLAPGAPVDVSADVASEASIINVTARSADPQLAADIANATGPQLASVGATFSALLRAAGQEVRATTVSPASAPTTPTSPNLPQNLLLALLAGLCAGIGLAFVRHAFDTRVRTADDLHALAPGPLLASLPVERDQRGIALETDPQGGYAEAVRRLRTNLMFVDVTTARHSFVITSAVPAEGKTTTAVNLALAMARSGGKVLLVDGDLRNPSVAKTMRIEGSVGLTTVLLGNAEVEDVVQPWRDSGLHVLPAGDIPPNPSELLGSEPMQQLFANLGQAYEFVLVDSPPIVPVTDAVLLDKLTGGTVMVVAASRTRKRDLTSALKSLETVGGRVAGFALNLVPTSEADTTRYGYYRYEEQGGSERRSGRRDRTATAQEQDRTRDASPTEPETRGRAAGDEVTAAESGSAGVVGADATAHEDSATATR